MGIGKKKRRKSQKGKKSFDFFLEKIERQKKGGIRKK